MTKERKSLDELMAQAGGYKVVSEDVDDQSKDETTDSQKAEDNENHDEKPDEVDGDTSDTQDDDEKDDSADDASEDKEEKKDDTPDESDQSDGTTDKEIPTVEGTSAEEGDSEDSDDETKDDAQESVFANEQVAKLNEYIAQGGTFEDFAKTQVADYSNMDYVSAIKEQIRMTEPGLEPDEIDLLMDDTYGVPKGASEKDRKLAIIRLKRDGEKARGTLLENQKKWQVPVESAEQKQARINKEREDWNKRLGESASKIDDIEFKLNDKESFKFKVDNGAKGKIKEDFSDISKFFKRYINKDGTENVDKFVRDMAILQNYESIIRAAAAHNKTKGKEEIVDDIKNPDFKGKDKKSDEKGSATIKDQARKAFFGQ